MLLREKDNPRGRCMAWHTGGELLRAVGPAIWRGSLLRLFPEGITEDGLREKPFLSRPGQRKTGWLQHHASWRSGVWVITAPTPCGCYCSPEFWSISGQRCGCALLPRCLNTRRRVLWLPRGGMRNKHGCWAAWPVIEDNCCPCGCGHHTLSEWKASTASGPLVHSEPGKELSAGLIHAVWVLQRWSLGKQEGGNSSTDTAMKCLFGGKGDFQTV